MTEERRKFGITYVWGSKEKPTFSLIDEEERASYAKHINKALKEFESATTLEEVLSVVLPISVKSREDACASFNNALLAKLKDIAPKELESATTIEEVRNIFDYCGSYINEIKIAALAKWNDMSLKELESAITLEDVRNVFENSPNCSEAKIAALAKWNDMSLKELESATTLEEVIGVFYYSPYCSEAERAAKEKAYALEAKRQQ
jgi:hypothetical protein